MKPRRRLPIAASVLLCLIVAVGCAEERDQRSAGREDSAVAADDFVDVADVEVENCRGPVSDMEPAADAVPGETGAFAGEVSSVQFAKSSTGSPVFINIVSDYPDPELSAAIFTNAAPSLARWARDNVRAGDIVCVSGEVRDFDGFEQILVTSSSAIEVVEEGPNTRAIYLAKPCAQVFVNFQSWSVPPSPIQIQRAMLKPDYPSSNDFRPGEVGYRVSEVLMRYQDEVELASYTLFDPNVSDVAAYDAVIRLADELEEVARACGELSSLGGKAPRDLLTRQR